MKTKILIDFDGTLFDTERHKADIIQLYLDAGLTMEQYMANHQAWKDAHEGHAHYEGEFEAAIAAFPDHGLKKADFDKIVANSADYLFSDVLDFLKQIDRDRFEPILFTLGDEAWQRKKVEACGLVEIFGEDNIRYPHGIKWENISKHIEPGEKFIILDDSQVFIDAVRDNYADTATIIQMDRYPKEDEETKPDDGIIRINNLETFSEFSPREHMGPRLV